MICRFSDSPDTTPMPAASNVRGQLDHTAFVIISSVVAWPLRFVGEGHVRGVAVT
jgi:hypothetical protein